MTQNVSRVLACQALLPDNPAAPLQKRNPNALKDELIRHVNEDSTMSAFEALVVETGPERRLPRDSKTSAIGGKAEVTGARSKRRR
jgi:hypothetical protein